MCTVSGIVTLPYHALIEGGLQSALNQCMVWQCDDIRYCTHTILVPPEDEHTDARNMLRSVM